MRAGPKWAWPSMRSPFVSGMRAIGSIAGGIGGFFAGGYSARRDFRRSGGAPITVESLENMVDYSGGSLLGSKVMTTIGEKIVERGFEGPGLARTLSEIGGSIAGPISTMTQI